MPNSLIALSATRITFAKFIGTTIDLNIYRLVQLKPITHHL